MRAKFEATPIRFRYSMGSKSDGPDPSGHALGWKGYQLIFWGMVLY